MPLRLAALIFAVLITLGPFAVLAWSARPSEPVRMPWSGVR